MRLLDDNKYPYNNWKVITESDFLTLFIKTWFAFVSTLREMHPAEIPYYQATGDSRYITPYKEAFSQNISYLLTYTEIEHNLYEVYRHGMKIIAERYPRFIVDDFYGLNYAYTSTASEDFALEGGFNGEFVCTIKCANTETVTATIMCTDKAYRAKMVPDYVPIGISVDYSSILSSIVQNIENKQFVLTEASLTERFYELLFDALSNAFFVEISKAKASIPEKGNKRFLRVFDAMQAFCTRAINAEKASCLNPEYGAEHKLLSQLPITNYLNHVQDGMEMTLADKEKAYLWFIGFVYRLRNALFHEIIDPLNDEWQVIFKNAYHVLKQIVDQNIWRLNNLKLLPLASKQIMINDYNQSPPPDIVWPADEQPCYTFTEATVKNLNKDGAKVALQANIDFANYHYQTSCVVKWDSTLQATKVSNAKIFEVPKADQ